MLYRTVAPNGCGIPLSAVVCPYFFIANHHVFGAYPGMIRCISHLDHKMKMLDHAALSTSYSRTSMRNTSIKIVFSAGELYIAGRGQCLDAAVCDLGRRFVR